MMWRGASSAVISAIAAAALCGCGGDRWPVIHNDSPHRIVIVFGDSLAAGVGASTPDHAFAAIMFSQLTNGDASSEFDDIAISGATVADVLDTQLPDAEARALDATDVWLCVGGNDIFHGTPTDAFSTTEHTVVARLRSDWPKAHIVVFGVPDVTRTPLLPGLAQFHDMASADNAAAKDAARESQADFVDLFSFTDSQNVAGQLSSDSLHPDDTGHAAIAAYADKKLR
ncbi:MAG TPA: SGNH/GDSL hydrolase family protein [Candidatus Eremiobacteraceae bacterium]|nr:SGNH/GDSL hydrolase family protein [Candidatus Eremiobacteraceae bacterium]